MGVQDLTYLDSLENPRGSSAAKHNSLRAVIIPEQDTFISDDNAIMGSFS